MSLVLARVLSWSHSRTLPVLFRSQDKRNLSSSAYLSMGSSNEVKLWYFGPTQIKSFTVTSVPKNTTSLPFSFLNKEHRTIMSDIGEQLQRKQFGDLTSYQKQLFKKRQKRRNVESNDELVVTWKMVHETGRFVKLNEHNYAYQAPYHVVCSWIDLQDFESFLTHTNMLLPEVAVAGMTEEKVQCFLPIFPSRQLAPKIEKTPSEGWHNKLEEFYSEKLFKGVKSAFKDVCDVFGYYPQQCSFFDVLKSLNVPYALRDTFLIHGKPDILMIKNKEGVVVNTAQNILAQNDEEWSAPIEVGHNLSDLTGHYQGYPKKCGELMGQLYILLISKIVKSILSGNNDILSCHPRVYGMLFGRTCENFFVCLSVDSFGGLCYDIGMLGGNFLNPRHIYQSIHHLVHLATLSSIEK